MFRGEGKIAKGNYLFIQESVCSRTWKWKTGISLADFYEIRYVSISQLFVYKFQDPLSSDEEQRELYMTYGYGNRSENSLLLLLTAIELSLGDSSPYTSTVKTNNNKYT